MLGANDLFWTDPSDPLARDDAFILQEHLIVMPLLMKFQLARRLRVLYYDLKGTGFYVEAGTGERPYFAAKTGEKSVLPILPTAKKEVTAEALGNYEANIVSLAALAVAHGISPIFTTQPILWKASMNPDEEAVDWLAGTVISNERHYRIPLLQQATVPETLN